MDRLRWVAVEPVPGTLLPTYLATEEGQIVTATSTDGGLAWSAPVAPPGPPAIAAVNGAQPLVQPDGTLVVLYSSLYGPSVTDDEMLAIRSTDGGATFSAPIRVAGVELDDVFELRSPTLPAGGVDASGRLYALWQDCRFSENCDIVGLVMSTSTDGLVWSAPVRVPTTPAGSRVHSLVPGFAVDPTTARRSARLALFYYTVSSVCDFLPSCPGAGAHMISSRNGGASWGRPQRLSTEPMRLSWIVDGGTIGRMLGNYETVSFVRGRAIPVFSLASEPALDGTFRQAIFARVR